MQRQVLSAGTKVCILETTQLPDGTKRARIAMAGKQSPLGWVSSFAKDGTDNLVAASSAMLPSARVEPCLRHAAWDWLLEEVRLCPARAVDSSHGVAPSLTRQSQRLPGRVPRLSGSASQLPFLPPSSASSGGLTARSTAKASLLRVRPRLRFRIQTSKLLLPVREGCS